MGGSPYCGNCLQFSWITFKKVPKWKLTFTNLNTFLHLFGILLLFHFQTWHRAALHTTSILVMTSSHSNYSHHSEDYICKDSSVISLNIAFFNVSRLFLLLPLSIFILYQGYQQWQQHRSFQAVSHSDIFAYHLAAMELIWILGTALFYCGSYLKFPNIVAVGYFLSTMIFCGESNFHILTCVECYLAVVHPITYRVLKNTRGIKIRNICIAFVWMFCFLWCSLALAQYPATPIIPLFCILVSSLAVTSYCCLCVLYALWEGSRDREQVDQSKQRAFFTIMAILGALCLLFLGSIITNSLTQSTLLSISFKCVAVVAGYWLNIPSCLVLPLLYLRRTGNLPCH